MQLWVLPTLFGTNSSVKTSQPAMAKATWQKIRAI